MSEPFIAEVRIFAGNFAPRGWSFCDGQLLPIAQNTALFSLIGTTYGGDGRTTTALPNLQGRAPMHPGSGPGLSTRRLGERVGAETVTLAQANLPPHTHSYHGVEDGADKTAPAGNLLGEANEDFYADVGSNTLVAMASSAMATTGGGQTHANMQPFLTLNFIIALQGVYPSRS